MAADKVNDKLNDKVDRIKKEIEDYFNSYFKSIYPYAVFSLTLISAEDLYSSDVKSKETLKGEVIDLKYFGDKNNV